MTEIKHCKLTILQRLAPPSDPTTDLFNISFRNSLSSFTGKCFISPEKNMLWKSPKWLAFNVAILDGFPLFKMPADPKTCVCLCVARCGTRPRLPVSRMLNFERWNQVSNQIWLPQSKQSSNNHNGPRKHLPRWKYHQEKLINGRRP